MAQVQLSAKAIGDIVKFKVNGTAREFIVVHKGKPSSMYDDSFNNGVILLMKDLYESRQWHSSNVNDYANSTIHTYLNGTFLNLIEENIRNAIVQVKVPYRPGSGTSGTVNSGANGLSAKIFFLSGYEMNWTSSTNQYFPADGATLSYFAGTAATDAKRIAYLSGSATGWWLRSPYINGSTYAWSVHTNGDYGDNSCSNSYGVRPALVLPSNLFVSDDGSVVTNQAPTKPSSITVPADIKYNTAYNVSWGTSTDADGNFSGYILERSVNGGAYAEVYRGTATSKSETLTRNQANTVAYRVKAYDAAGAESEYETSAARTVVNNVAPVISGSDGSLGQKNEPFTQTYTVTDTDNDSVTVTEKLDNVTLRSYTAVLGATNTFEVTGETFLTVLNGSHTLTVTANDGTANVTRTWTFDKSITVGTLSMTSPFETEEALFAALTTVTRQIPDGAIFKLEVCNNAFDAAPTWEDMTAEVSSGNRYYFENTTKTAAKWGFNFRLTADRNGKAGNYHISGLGGNFK